MYRLVMYISLLLSIVPAQSRSVANFFSRISDETDASTEQDDVPMSRIMEEQGLEEPVIMFGDIAVATGLQNADECTVTGCKWDRSRDGNVYVPYAISRQYSPDERQVIETGLQSFQESTCIRFIPHNGQRHFINIESVKGCYSYLGRQGGSQVVSLERPGCINSRNVQHELLHALGFHHEQNRSDRDEHVKIIFKNIEPGHERNFKKVPTNNLATHYDYNSVMHYPSNAFSRSDEPTIIPIPDPNVLIGKAKKMSYNDILRVNRLYCA
ncbi:low choriolytic enzyme-like isoform X3 [Triplophysa rosa]|uniref:low choriolytic enzyme-like isoform X3 n=1 Tax=Triplophysa rosa TaxID=992332 RepID=UPI00254605AA|nr:low choriolytic enzyme-like isoform X3 [Triplophysa rosa]